MATEKEIETTDEEYRRPNPQDNPRNIALKEIAEATAKQHEKDFAETAPSVDEEGNVTEAKESSQDGEPPSSTPEQAASSPEAEPATPASPKDAVDPEKMYKVKVDGQEMEVSGKAIIDAGYRTFQKETAADFRLKMASELLKEAEAKARTATQPSAIHPAKPTEKTDAELANALQFGTPEQAADALSLMRGRGAVTPDQVQQFASQQARIAAKDEVQFQEALKFVQDEYGDILSNAYLKDLFFLQENKLRAAGDKRVYKDLYKTIGEDLRTAFKMTKPASGATSGSPTPAGTAAARQALKKETPPVPRTASSRMTEAAETGKVRTASEIIAGMAAQRGKAQLTNFRKT